MPCDVGYRTYVALSIPVPKPLVFKKKVEAPKIDAKLLQDIGEEDSAFAEWLSRLSDADVKKLLEQALKKAKKHVKNSGRVTFTIDSGCLEAKATYTNASEQGEVEGITDEVTARFQIEVLAMVADILDYETRITEVKVKNEAPRLLLEGEKHE